MTVMRSSFENVKKLMTNRLRKRYRDAWAMYYMVCEMHWKPSEIIKMKPWEVACVMAISERQGQEFERISKK